jgi:hypothetical protein
MITHIVTLVHPKKLVQRNTYNEFNGRETIAAMHARTVADPVENYNKNNFLDLLTFYFDNERDAKYFAEFAASERPGIEVYVAEAKFIYNVEIGAPVAKKITDKGVLPV